MEKRSNKNDIQFTYEIIPLRNVFSRYGTHSIRFHQEEHEYFLKDYLTPDGTQNLSNVK